MASQGSKSRRYHCDLTLPDPTYGRLKALAEEHGTTVPVLVRRLIAFGLLAVEAQESPVFALLDQPKRSRKGPRGEPTLRQRYGACPGEGIVPDSRKDVVKTGGRIQPTAICASCQRRHYLTKSLDAIMRHPIKGAAKLARATPAAVPRPGKWKADQPKASRKAAAR